MKQAKAGEQLLRQTLLPVVILLTLTAVWIAPIAAAAPQSRTSFCETGIRTQPSDPQTKLSVNLAVNEIIGNTVTAYATLTDSKGGAIVAAPVHFYLGNQDSTGDWVGHAITDCDGVAILKFTREKAGPIEITAKFDGNNALKENQISASLELKRIATQQPALIQMDSLGFMTSMVIIVVAALTLGVLTSKIAIEQDKRDTLLDKHTASG